MKKILPKVKLFVIILLALGGALFLLSNELKENEPEIILPPKKEGTQNNSEHELIQVSFPFSGEKIGGEINVTGIAKGNWYFEGEFPIELLTPEGKKLTGVPALAEGEWMREGFVPFSAKLRYPVNEETEAKLVLHRNNPSDLREQDAKIEIPVILTPEMSSLNVFWGSKHLAPGISICDQVFPAARSGSESMASSREALEQLLQGPTEKERELGYFTAIPHGVKIQNFDATTGTARVDLGRELLDLEVDTACSRILIQKQITETIKRASTAQAVMIEVDGKPFPGEFPDERPANF